MEADLEVAISAESFAKRKQLAEELTDWLSASANDDDVRFRIEAFDPCIAFGDADHAREFMKHMHSRLLASAGAQHAR